MEPERKILRKYIIPGTSDADIGIEGNFLGLEYTIYEPIPGVHEIFNEGLPIDDQVWKAPQFPDYSRITKQECQNIFVREIRRIEYGIYVWIGGELTYITGTQYLGMVHWKLKESNVDYAIYTETQRDICYMLDLCASDPKCVGAIIFSLKRLGKSEWAQIEMFRDALLASSGRYIVQALNDDEAIDIFGKTHYANENLHKTFPVWPHKFSKDEQPAENLVALRRDSTKDSIVWKSADGIEGSNEVSFSVKPTKLSGIQGKKIKRAFLDEFASLKPIKDMNLKNYHAKAIAQCTEDFGSVVMGKLWLIATAENLESESLIEAKEIWDGSAEDKKDANGFTRSRLKRMFIPYYRGGRSDQFIDKFGRPKIEDAKRWYQNSIAAMTDSQRAIFRRQNPENIRDVFDIEHEGGLEADVIEICKRRLQEIKLRPSPLYNISKYNGEIVLSPLKPGEKEGDFTVEFFEPVQEHHSYRAGVDATSTAKNSTNKTDRGNEVGKEKSKFALVIRRITGENQYVDVANIFIRPSKRYQVEKAALWLLMYYNKYGKCRAYPERNASAGSTLTDLFEGEGQQRILIRQLRKHNTDKLDEKSSDGYGIYIDGNQKDYRTSVMNKFNRIHGHKTNSKRLLENLLIYGLDNSDLADADGVCNMACGNFDPEKPTEKAEKRSSITYVNRLKADGRWERVQTNNGVQKGVTQL